MCSVDFLQGDVIIILERFFGFFVWAESIRTSKFPSDSCGRRGGWEWTMTRRGKTACRVIRLRRQGQSGALANHRKRWDAKPEAVGRPPSRNAGPSYARSAALCNPRGGQANHRKRWDAEPEAVGRLPLRNAGPSYVHSAAQRNPEGNLANHWKQWDAKPEASELSSTFVRLQSGKPRETVRRKTRG